MNYNCIASNIFLLLSINIYLYVCLHNITYVCACTLSAFFYLVVDCGHPGTPSNGSSNFISTILDATVIHSCDSGYVLCNGDETRTCQSDLLWSGILPECISEFYCASRLMIVSREAKKKQAVRDE